MGQEEEKEMKIILPRITRMHTDLIRGNPRESAAIPHWRDSVLSVSSVGKNIFIFETARAFTYKILKIIRVSASWRMASWRIKNI